MSRPKLLEVRALSNYRLWLRYEDGAKGEVDLSRLAGRGVFQAWDDPRFFKAVHLGSHGEITWGNEIDLCSDALYMQLTGKEPEEVFPNLKETGVDA